MVVLASGDPLFYGVARYLCDKLGKDRFEVVPHVSSMQLAFARVKESWEEAYLTNLANRPLDQVIEKIRVADKVGLFTSDDCPPKAVAKALLDRRIDYFSAYVCENLGSPDERVTQGELAEIAGQDFSPLNVMILVRRPNVPDRPSEAIGRRLFGNPDEAFLQSKPKHGLLTPAEVRSIALAELDLGPTSIVWDIGAGSGSVAIEAAQIASGGTVYAIEMDPRRSSTDHWPMPSDLAWRTWCRCWAERPRPGPSCPIPTRLRRRQRPRNQPHCRAGLRAAASPAAGWWPTSAASKAWRRCTSRCSALAKDVNVWMINIARGTYQLERVRFEALNPTFLLSVVKPRRQAIAAASEPWQSQ